ncbi:peptidoglycan-binding protein [Glutamicibacter sp. ZJUTW]|uniref:peptidoglycan-binding protein n=1 Tax=Glutamicibacter sp. ZJUTW TaxID=1155384 RepID=UPI0011F10C80|nr:peptidoglycan-binding protein [Glutamicibacter sp. ZJUTW]QEP08726.1 hypothetical protein F0M17_16575 [Glutamicibacter sp. ZJUTW]
MAVKLTRLGWDVLTAKDKRLVNFPWVTGKVRNGDHYIVLDYLARRFHEEVEPIVRSKSWGWAARSVRGLLGIPSEHNAGVAIDTNAPDHWLGLKGTFTNAQERKIRAIVADCGGAVRWGGDYAGRKDEMHFELKGGNVLMKKIADQIRAGQDLHNPPPAKIEPVASKPDPVWDGLSVEDTKAVQRYLRSIDKYDGEIDGKYQSMTKAGVKSFQTDAIVYGGAKFKADGEWGPLTQRWFEWVRDVLQPAVVRWKASKRLGRMLADGHYGKLTNRHVAAVQKSNRKRYNPRKYKIDGQAGEVFCEAFDIPAFKW